MPKTRKNTDNNAMLVGKLQHGQQIKGRVWIERDGQTFLSWGRVTLLERIAEHGSVSAAAKSMKMSFRHAWHLVEQMNTLSPEPLVEKQTGGKKGGGAWLTPDGQKAIRDFWNLVDKFQDLVEHQQL